MADVLPSVVSWPKAQKERKKKAKQGGDRMPKEKQKQESFGKAEKQLTNIMGLYIVFVLSLASEKLVS